VRMMRLPNKWSCGTRTDWNPAPKLGQQSVEVLKEIGLDEATIDAMIASGATSDGRLER
jgi:crotonobetainyl-CoA:carnitine CoA-transferase CaiB-like acyl-CoA transferase